MDVQKSTFFFNDFPCRDSFDWVAELVYLSNWFYNMFATKQLLIP